MEMQLPVHLPYSVDQYLVSAAQGRFDFENYSHGDASTSFQTTTTVSGSVHHGAVARNNTTTSTRSSSASWSRTSAVEKCTTATPGTRHCALPTLVKTPARSYTYVDGLVDAAVLITRRLWDVDHNIPGSVLRQFIVETSRKSKTSLSTMQLALMYCLRLRRTMDGFCTHRGSLATTSTGPEDLMHNFLTALILASKYLQDRNFSNKAWAKISMVDVGVINANERRFLAILDWNLHISTDRFKRWTDVVGAFTVELREATLFGNVAECESRLNHLVDKVLNLTDSGVCSLMKRGGPVLHGLEQEPVDLTPKVVDTALFTPADSPSSSYSAEYVAAPVVVVVAPEVETDVDVSDDDDADATSLFDEFIKATPLQQCADDDPSQLCLTPRSLDTGSESDSVSSSPVDNLVLVEPSQQQMAKKIEMPPSPAASFTSETGCDVMLCPAMLGGSIIASSASTVAGQGDQLGKRFRHDGADECRDERSIKRARC